MKLKSFNPDTCPTIRNTEAFIHLNTKTGLFSISKKACDEMGLSPGDKIVFHQDDAEPENWFLQNLGKKGNGFELRENQNQTPVCYSTTHYWPNPLQIVSLTMV